MRLRLTIAVILLALASGGCLYMPPPPTAIWPLEEGETQIRLHLTADLLALERGQTLLATMGFYPSLRYALSCDQEMVFFPWPAYRHWGGLAAGGGLRYHQVSLGKFAPVESFVRRGYARALLGDLGTEYLRYDFLRISGPSADVCWISLAPEREDPYGTGESRLAERSRDFWGFSLALRGQLPGEGAADLELCGTLGRASNRLGGSLEPSLAALRILKPPRSRSAGEPQRWWLRHLRLGIWGGQ